MAAYETANLVDNPDFVEIAVSPETNLRFSKDDFKTITTKLSKNQSFGFGENENASISFVAHEQGLVIQCITKNFVSEYLITEQQIQTILS